MVTVKKEIEFLKLIHKEGLRGFSIQKKGSLEEKIVKILVKSGAKNWKPSNDYMLLMIKQTKNFIAKNEPIEIKFSIAYAGRIMNQLKNINGDFSPNYGWLKLLGNLKYMDLKVKKIYSPGLSFTIYEEMTLAQEIAPWFIKNKTKEEIDANLYELSKWCKILELDLKVIKLHRKNISGGKVSNVILEDQIFGMVCSHPDMNDEKIMNKRYSKRGNVDYKEIKREFPVVWEQSLEFLRDWSALMARRKEVYYNDNAIDAKILRDPNRLLIKAGSNSIYMNHGVAVVQKYPKYNVTIIPEYWVKKHGLTPVYDKNGKIFYYIEE